MHVKLLHPFSRLGVRILSCLALPHTPKTEVLDAFTYHTGHTAYRWDHPPPHMPELTSGCPRRKRDHQTSPRLVGGPYISAMTGFFQFLHQSILHAPVTLCAELSNSDHGPGLFQL